MADYEKFKETGLSRVVLTNYGNEQELHTVAPPVSVYNPPALKRGTFREGRSQAPKRIASNSSTILRGNFTQFIYTKPNGYVIGKFKPCNGNCIYTVKGVLPVIDLFYQYQLRCKEMFKGNVYYEIESLHSTTEHSSLTVLPIPGTSLIKLLMEHCRYSKEEAQKIVFEVYAPIARPSDYGINKRLKISVVILEFDYICRNFNQTEWFKHLSFTWVPLLYKDFPKLLELGWSLIKLSTLSPDQIIQLSTEITTNPWDFLVDNRNTYNLPAIDTDKILVMNRLFNTEISAYDVECINFYNQASHYIQKHKKISLTVLDYDKIRGKCQFPPFYVDGRIVSPSIGALSQTRRLMVVNYEKDPAIGEGRYYRWHEFEALRRLAVPLRRIMRQNILSIPPPTEEQQEKHALIWKGFDPTPEQRSCYNRLTKENILLITGGPGTGKTAVIDILKTRYRSSAVGVFVAYGTIADKLALKLKMDISTLAMAIDQIDKGNSNGDRYLKMEVVFIDEISLVDLVTFERFLTRMRNIKILVMTGDEYQSGSIAACPVVHGLLKKWEGTPFEQKFTKIFRAKNPILLYNLNLLRFGNYNIQYSTILASDHPFILQHRLRIPLEFQKGETDVQRLGRVSILKKELEPIYKHYQSNKDIFDNMLIVTQRIKDVKDLNHAWWCLTTGNGINVSYNENEFTVGETIMFVGDNLNNPNVLKKDYLRSTSVKNKSTAIISAIWDFQPFCDEAENPYTRAISVKSTDAKKDYHMERIIQFTNGHQVNLKEYPISNLRRGYAVTTASVQGLQCKLLVYYVQPGKTKYLTREEFYTGCSRTSGRVIVIQEVKNENLHNSDMRRIANNPTKRHYDILPTYLPSYEQKNELATLTNPFESLSTTKSSPTAYDMDSLSNSSIFGSLFSNLNTGPLEGYEIMDENAHM